MIFLYEKTETGMRNTSPKIICTLGGDDTAPEGAHGLFKKGNKNACVIPVTHTFFLYYNKQHKLVFVVAYIIAAINSHSHLL